MAQAAEKIIEFPAGGIADFYMEDDEIEALGQLEAEEQFGNKGIANFSVVAERMASYGRHGDDTVAHVETGELVIPKALIEDNPKLRDSIFEHLEELGVKDPERYVVGSGANSINPDTGLPEFFFKKVARAVKKTVKKVSRAVKKVAKSVVKVVKKAAPIILPFVLGPAGLGLNMMYAGALGAGIGTLIQGGDLKQAFTAALVGGAIGAVSQGVQSGFAAGKGNFMKGFTQGVKNVATNPMQSSFTQAMSSSLQPAAVADVTAAGSVDAAKSGAGLDVASVPPPDQMDYFTQPPEFPDAQNLSARVTDGTFTGADAALADTTGAQLSEVTTPYEPRSFLENIQAGEFKEAFLPSGPTPEQVLLQKQKAYTDALATYGVTPATASTAQQTAAAAEAAKVTAASMGPGLTGYLPLAGAGVGAVALAGGFTPKEDPPQEELPTGMEYYEQDPLRYGLSGGVPTGTTGDIVVASDYQQGYGPRIPYRNPFVRPIFSQTGQPVVGHLAQLARQGILAVAEGGEIFPRRVGGIMPDEGTPGKDSVRAMLMPGEFVMTTNAVKGLGDGDNDKGINRMYDMMRGLEAKGRAMA